MTLVHQAVGQEDGQAEFTDYAAFNLSSIQGFGSTLASRFRPVDHYPVDTCSLDTYRARGNPAPQLVKIDVEGYESHVLEGMPRMMREDSPILLFEALGAEELERNLETLSRLAPETYRLVRIAHHGELVAPEQTEDVTNNFFAIPTWAEERFATGGT